METVNAYIPTDSYTDYDGSYAVMEDAIATVRLTAPKKVQDSNGYDEGGAYVQYLRVPRGVDKSLLSEALRHTMGGSSCRHAYDCCGCSTRFIITKMTAPRRMQVKTRIYYNY